MTPSLFLAAALALFSPAIDARTHCSDAAIECLKNEACGRSFRQHYTECSSAYITGGSSDCTSTCNKSLTDAIRIEPALYNCECVDYSCSKGQRNLVKACYGRTLKAKYCADFSADCLGDTACATVLNNYLSDCSAVRDSGKQADCSENCLTSLKALRETKPAFKTCPCGGEPMCDGPKKCGVSATQGPTTTNGAAERVVSVFALTWIVAAFFLAY